MTAIDYKKPIIERAAAILTANPELYIFGAGVFGKFAYEHLSKKYKVAGFIESAKDKQGTVDTETGLTVFSLDDIPSNSSIVAASYNYWHEMLAACRAEGFELCAFYEELTYYDADLPLWNMAYDGIIEGVFESADGLRKIYDLLEDDISREVLKNVLQFRLTLDPDYTHKAFELSGGPTKQYFDDNIVKLDNNEVFVDCGGFCGENTAVFLELTKGKSPKVCFFEPAEDNIRKAKEILGEEENIVYLPYGAGSKKETLRFKTVRGNDESGAFCDGGDMEITVSTIDAEASDATFIKMDIEGMELEALKGAAGTIKARKPKLAICVYHKPTDIVDLTNYVLSIRNDYKLFFRHYTEIHADTVMYFI